MSSVTGASHSHHPNRQNRCSSWLYMIWWRKKEGHFSFYPQCLSNSQELSLTSSFHVLVSWGHGFLFQVFYLWSCCQASKDWTAWWHRSQAAPFAGETNTQATSPTVKREERVSTRFSLSCMEISLSRNPVLSPALFFMKSFLSKWLLISRSHFIPSKSRKSSSRSLWKQNQVARSHPRGQKGKDMLLGMTCI